MWRRLLAVAGWALPQPSANLNPMLSVAQLSRACAVRPGCPAQLVVMCSPSQRLAAWLLRCYRPHREGRLFCLTRCALPRRRHLAAPSHTPFTHFGDWRRFPAPRAVDHCVRLLLCSMWEGDVLGGQGATPAGATACSRCALSAVIENGVGTSTKGTPLTVRVRRCRVSRCRLAACLALHPYELQRDWLPRRRPTHHPHFLRNRFVVTADPLTLSLRFAAMGEY